MCTREEIYNTEGNILCIEHKDEDGNLEKQEFFFDNKNFKTDIYYEDHKIIIIHNRIYNHVDGRYIFHGDRIEFNVNGDIYIHEFYKNGILIKTLYDCGILQIEN
jgi:hypothetical protein